MNVDYLRKNAARLQQPSGEAADAFERECVAIGEKLSQSMLARPDIEDLIGEGNTELVIHLPVFTRLTDGEVTS